MTELYRDSGLEIYEKSHYSHGEHILEIEQILSWYSNKNMHILDIGCSGGLHAIEFAKRGFSVTGVDMEPSSIELARKRKENLKLDFRVLDIENNELLYPEKFGLIYSLGNVFSHIKKGKILEVIRKIKDCLSKNGILLFDVLINSKPFEKEIIQDDLQIIWKREIDEKTGSISMDGIFLESGFIQHFDVWGYTIEEMKCILERSGFEDIEFSEKLDLIEKNKTKNPISLYFRAKVKGNT
jgi:SAM-dependent methyltransferase